MIYCAGVFYAERASHMVTIAEEKGKCNEKDLTLNAHVNMFA
jgi:hypothetical protein